jgi:hypothetical protein
MPQGALPISIETFQGGSTKLNLPASTVSLVKASAGRIMQININTVLSAALTVYDSSTTAGTAASNIVYVSAATAAAGTILVLDFPVVNGIVVGLAGTGAASVSYL